MSSNTSEARGSAGGPNPQGGGLSVATACSMSELAKGVLMMPVLNSRTLGKKASIEKFVQLFDGFLVNKPTARFAEAVEGDAWKIIAVMCPDLPTLPAEVQNEEFRRELLKMHSTTSQPELLIKKWGKIKMPKASNGVVNLEHCIQYFVEFLAAVNLTTEEERPRAKLIRDVFVAGVQPLGFQRVLKEKFLKTYKDVEVMLHTFLLLAKEQVALQNQLAAFQDADDDVATTAGSQANVQKMVKAMVAEQLGVPDTAADPAPPLSKNARKKAKSKAAKVALNAKFTAKSVAVADANKVCWGCGHGGHGRNTCPNKNRKGFVKFPNKATGPIAI